MNEVSAVLDVAMENGCEQKKVLCQNCLMDWLESSLCPDDSRKKD